MHTGVKKLFALLLVLALAVGFLPAQQTRAAEPEVLTQADYAEADLVLAQIEEALAAPAKKDATQTQKTQAAMDIVMASEGYVAGSLEQNGAAFTWMTDAGIRCIYSPRMQKISAQQKDTGLDAIVNEPVATKGGSPTGNQVYLIGPYYGYDENFTDQYKNEAKRVADAIGDADGYTLYSGNAATIDKVAEAVSNGAVVFFDSHGGTDYENPNNENDCITKATTSYLCLHTTNGLTTQDYNDGAAYSGSTVFVTGTTIANHMTKQSPSGLLWMAICLGMATDTMYKPMREMGVEVVHGYSESVTFAGEYLWEETFWDTMLDGGTVAQASAAMKEKWGCWDWSGEMAQYFGYQYNEGYTTISEARADFSAFPVVVSDEDAWPGKRTASSYGASSLQTVKSAYDLNNIPEIDCTVSFVVPGGVSAIAPMHCDNSGITLPTAASPNEEYTFVGWTTQTLAETTTQPTLYNGKCCFTEDTTLYAVYMRTEGGSGQWTLVTSTAQLSPGSQVVIAGADRDYALSTTQNNNNRGSAAITRNGTTLELSDNVQVLTLEAGTATGSYAFHTGSGYLYTNATGANRLYTQTGLDKYASFTVTVTSSGVATVQNVGNTSRGLLRLNYNGGNPIFSCYGSGQEDIALYAKSGTAYYTTSPVTCSHENVVFWEENEPTCTEDGNEPGIYCTDCQTVIEGGAVIPAAGHEYEAVVTAPTATAQGFTTYTCATCGDTYVSDYVPALGNTYTVSFAVPQGVAAVAGMACSNAGITLPTPGAPAGYTFVGWAEAAVEKTEVKPQVYTGSYRAEDDITLYAVYSITEGSGAAGFTLVTDASQLSAGVQVIIAAAGYNKAMSVTQNNNNRAAASISKSGSTLTYGSDTVLLELRAGTVSGSFAFYDANKNGYLYAASSTKNYLRTESTLSNNSSWKITVDSTGKATVTAQGSNSHNVMQYNSNGTPLFGCYTSASQKPVSLYVKGSSVTYYTSLDASLAERVAVGDHTYATVAEALKDTSGEYITLLADIAEDVYTTEDLMLDLNGHVLTGDVVMAAGTFLRLFDSATADYTAENRGKLVGSIDGNLIATINTPASYGHNYKYLTILEADGSYSAHRIYLAVQSVKLTPASTGIRYKSLFKCNEVVAQYVESFGVRVEDQEYTFTTAPVGGSNYGTIQVGNILDARDPEATADNAYTQIALAPVVTMKDGLGVRVEATSVSYSLQEVVQLVNASFDTLSQSQQHALQYMYRVYEAVMGIWPEDIVSNFRKH